jgi:predicted outer membrane repeat protein
MKTKQLLLISLILGLGLAAGAVLMLSQTPTAQAAGPWYVSPSGNNSDCLSWATACTTIDGALNKASSGDTIHVGAGTYVENVHIGKDIIIQGAGAGSTFIDGSRSGPTIEVYQNYNLTISGVTVRNGYRSGDGGGIFIRRDCTVQVADATIFDNVATGSGGGIHMEMLSTLTLSNTTVISNSAGANGGGINSTAPGGSLTIINSTISDNAATLLGGGVYQNAGTLTIEGSSIISNTSQNTGGGIAKSNGTMDIRKSVFAENTSFSYGGGVYGSSGAMTIEDSTVRDNRLNSAGGRGGGIFSDAEMTLTNVTVAGNTSLDDGGGIHSQDPMTLTNVTVSGNTSGNGGGILHTGGSTMTLLNCTIVTNTIGAGGGPGGMRAYSPVSMRNTIVANNESANCNVGGSLTSLGYNLESADTCGLNATGDITNTNPLLGPLQDNGGTTVGLGEPTLTHALLPKSPAINAGDPAFSPPPEYDQRGVGFPRVLYGRVDIGAYEVTVILDHYVYLPLVLKD